MRVSAIGLLGSFWKQLLGQPLTEAVFQLAEGVGAYPLNRLGGARTQGSQAVDPGTKERSVMHIRRYIYRLIDSLARLFFMPTKHKMTLPQYQAQYAGLRDRLKDIGWISEGYVQDRGPCQRGVKPSQEWANQNQPF